MEESATPFSLSACDVIQSPPEVPKELDFYHDEWSGVLMGYDVTSDIHHFFVCEETQANGHRPQC
jgi:hypothetical protein